MLALIALILGIVAAVCFFVDYSRGRSLLALGLGLLASAHVLWHFTNVNL